MAIRSSLAPLYVPAPHHGGAFKSGQPRVIVIHSLESPMRAGIAAELARGWMQTEDVSVHYIVDPAETVQCLSEDTIGWGAGTVNSCAIHIEQSGYAAFTRAQWTTTDGLAQLHRVGDLVADIARRHDIPVRWLTDAQLRAAWEGTGPGGLATHSDCTRVIGGTTHTDPGAGYPRDLLLARAQSKSGKPATVTPGTTYTVRPGDTLSDIAADYGTTVAALVSLNNITDPDRIDVGQVIRLASKEAPVTQPKSQTPQQRYDELADQYGIGKAAFDHFRTQFAKVVGATTESECRRYLVDFNAMFDGKTYTADQWLHLLRARLNVEMAK